MNKKEPKRRSVTVTIDTFKLIDKLRDGRPFAAVLERVVNYVANSPEIIEELKLMEISSEPELT